LLLRSHFLGALAVYKPALLAQKKKKYGYTVYFFVGRFVFLPVLHLVIICWHLLPLILLASFYLVNQLLYNTAPIK
jgi:hypothetical protein